VHFGVGSGLRRNRRHVVGALPTPEFRPGSAWNQSSRPDLVEAVQVSPQRAMRLPLIEVWPAGRYGRWPRRRSTPSERGPRGLATSPGSPAPHATRSALWPLRTFTRSCRRTVTPSSLQCLGPLGMSYTRRAHHRYNTTVFFIGRCARQAGAGSRGAPTRRPDASRRPRQQLRPAAWGFPAG
jgi:hypothetical protein